MREVLKWSKNYRTGEEVSEKVLKPDNLIGQAKIEVRDSVTGDLVQEVETHNIIVPPAKFISSAYYETLFQSLANSTNRSFGVTEYSPEAFAYIILSDCKDEEDENKMTYRGNVVGWSPRKDQNPGTDPTRGVYNPLESFTEYKNGYYHAHLVYDFATSQANGDINSIWWTLGTASTNNKSYMSAPFRAWGMRSYNRANTLDIDYNYIYRTSNDKYYYYSESKYREIKNFHKWIQGFEAMNLAKENVSFSVIKSNIYPRQFNFEGRDVYCSVNLDEVVENDSYRDNAENKLIKDVTFKFKRIKKEDNEIEASYEFKFNEAFADIYEACFNAQSTYQLVFSHRPSCIMSSDGILSGTIYLDNYNDRRVYPKYDQSTDQMTLNAVDNQSFGYELDMKTGNWIIKPGFTKESLKKAIEFNSSNQRYIYDQINLYGMNISTCISNDNSNIFINGKKFNRQTLRLSSSNSIGLFFNYYRDGYFNTTEHDGYSQLYKLIPSACAHSKLPETVTKTNTDTMKIQYDYYIQMPYLIPDEKGNYIPEAAPIM